MTAAVLVGEDLGAMDDRVERLAAVRRVDWRFLLPEPTLGRVACLAPCDPDVVTALRAVGASVELLEADGDAARGGFDVVVARDASKATAARARALLAPGGWLCAEVGGRAAGRAVRALRASGFDAVEASWQWPRASACRELVPLTPHALRQALGRRDPGGRLRLRVRVATALAGTPLARLLVRDAIVVGSAR